MDQLKAALDANFGHTGVNAVSTSNNSTDVTEMQIYEAVKRILSNSGSIDISEIQSRISSEFTSPKTTVLGDFDNIRRLLESTPCFGNDIDEVDMVARKCAQIYCFEVEKYTNPRGGQFQAGVYQYLQMYYLVKMLEHYQMVD